MSEIWAAWLDGALVDPTTASVPITDRAVTVGLGCFSTLKVIRSQPFALDRHVARLQRSARILGIGLATPAAISEAAEACIEAGGRSEGRLRLTATAGAAGSEGVGVGSLLATVGPLPDRSRPAELATSPYLRNEASPLAGIKSTSYAEHLLAAAHAASLGADEALLLNSRAEVCEGTGSNLFAVIDHAVVTPPVESGLLDGVTRQITLEHFDVEERTLSLDEVRSADELFLTSTTRDIQPVARLDDVNWSEWPVTGSLARRWETLVAGSTEP